MCPDVEPTITIDTINIHMHHAVIHNFKMHYAIQKYTACSHDMKRILVEGTNLIVES